jgi:hypothetical protein
MPPWYYPETRPQRLPLTTPVRPASGGTGGPPTGPAGGDLAGSYPNPTLAPGAVGTTDIVDSAVTDAKITSVAYAKVTGAPAIPTTLPPSGPAGGDLTGTYPNPTVGAAKVTRAKIAPDAWLSPIPADPANVGHVLTVDAGPALAWTNTPHLDSIYVVNNVWITNGALAWSGKGTSIATDDYGSGPLLSYTDGGGGHSWHSTAGELMHLAGPTSAAASLHLRPQAGDGLVGSEALEINGGLIVKAATAATPQDGTLQFAGGHFQGRIGAAWLQLDNTASLPPSGTAGGDLSGTYPNPQLGAGVIVDADVNAAAAIQGTKLADAPNGIPTAKLNDGAVTNAKVASGLDAVKITTGTLAQARLPVSPSGLLTTNLNDSQVTDAKIAGMAYSKLTGAPTALPPSGTASGDLSGTYPSPQIAAGVIVDADVSATAAIQYSKLTGVPTALPPSGSASGDLTGTYPAPTIAKLNGATVGTTTPLARGDILVANATPALVRLARGTVNQVLQSNGTDVVWGPAPATGGPPTGAAGGSLAGSYPNPTLATSGVTAGTYGTQYKVAQITVNAEGRVTAVVEVTVRARWG